MQHEIGSKRRNTLSNAIREVAMLRLPDELQEQLLVEGKKAYLTTRSALIANCTPKEEATRLACIDRAKAEEALLGKNNIESVMVEAICYPPQLPQQIIDEYHRVRTSAEEHAKREAARLRVSPKKFDQFIANAIECAGNDFLFESALAIIEGKYGSEEETQQEVPQPPETEPDTEVLEQNGPDYTETKEKEELPQLMQQTEEAILDPVGPTKAPLREKRSSAVKRLADALYLACLSYKNKRESMAATDWPKLEPKLLRRLFVAYLEMIGSSKAEEAYRRFKAIIPKLPRRKHTPQTTIWPEDLFGDEIEAGIIPINSGKQYYPPFVGNELSKPVVRIVLTAYFFALKEARSRTSAKEVQYQWRLMLIGLNYEDTILEASRLILLDKGEELGFDKHVTAKLLTPTAAKVLEVGLEI